VAVVVVHEPGSDFDDVLSGLASQQYPNLNCLFLITSEPGELPTRIKTRLPGAFVRAVPSNPGFGPAANEALRLVEGSGLFCFMHDDVALDPDTIAVLVEELYRSNAGIVGPKLVDWEHPEVLQHVGMDVDRFAEVDPLVEPGEVDQEQHDAVRDVFAVPSACLLTRADLFRSLGGFHPGYSFHGEDIELCWRAHLNGARVLVVPEARARHREQLATRRPDLRHRTLAASHRADTVASLTTRSRLPLVLVQRVLLAIVETFVGLFSRRARGGLAAIAATLGTIGRLPSIIARRKLIRPLRLVPASEISDLQLRGSARLSRFLRRRGQQQSGSWRDRQLNAPAAMTAAWLIVLALFVVGSRQLITDGVPRVGQFVALPDPGSSLRAYLAGWNQQGFGTNESVPTGIGLLALVTRFVGAGGFIRLLLVIGPVLVGYLGAWRMASFFPSTRARVGALITYAAIPLPYAAIAGGRWGVLAAYAAMPWVVELLRLASGLWVAGTSWGDDDIADIVTPLGRGNRIRLIAGLGLLGGVVGAFVPTFPLIIVAVAVAMVIGTLLARGALTVLAGLATATAALIVAALLNIPWSGSLIRSGGWSDLVGIDDPTRPALGLFKLSTFQIGPSVLAPLSLGFYLAVVAAPIIGRGWRLTWAARSASLVLCFTAVAVLDDRGALPFRLPEVGLLLAPVACGLALSAACAIAGFEHDIRGATFGWRQPLGLVVGLGLVAGLLPGLGAATNGRWSAPTLTLSSYLRQIPGPVNDDPSLAGDYRMLFIGDPVALPAPSRLLYPGVGFLVAEDGPLGIEDQWLASPNQADDLTVEAMRAIAAVTTTRAGRLLGPLGIRYIVIPTMEVDGEVTTPLGLIEALSSQLDLRLVASPDELVIYENTSWLPLRGVLDATAVASSGEAGARALAGKPLGRANGVLINQDPPTATVAVPSVPGVLNLAYFNDGGWLVRADGRELPVRPSFGWSTAVELPQAEAVTVERRPADGRRLAVGLQVLCWLIAIAVTMFAGRVRWIAPGSAVVETADPGTSLLTLDGDDGDLDIGAVPWTGTITPAEPSALPVSEPPVDPVAESPVDPVGVSSVEDLFAELDQRIAAEEPGAADPDGPERSDGADGEGGRS
jgi:GT2 family glycosyltransferase